MSSPETPAPAALLQMMTGHWRTQSITVVAKLGIADLLAEGPKTSEELAAACGVHAPSLYRLLRALASVGIFSEGEGQRFGLTPMAELLRSDHPGSLRAAAIFYGSENYQGWGELLWSVQNGEAAFIHHYGAYLFDYLEANPQTRAIFSAMMTGLSAGVAKALAEVYDFSACRLVVDVGGAQGRLVATILQANPHLRGILFDLPDIAGQAAAYLASMGVAGRCEVVGGDFFVALPSGDTYVLRYILHDWNDDQCRTILEKCRLAMTRGGRILIIEWVIPPANEPSFGKFLDLTMMVQLTGRERTEAEYRALLEQAGLHIARIIPTGVGPSIIEAVAA
jgi:hypothetical protein